MQKSCQKLSKAFPLGLNIKKGKCLVFIQNCKVIIQPFIDTKERKYRKTNYYSEYS
jgi:hypothetical protein